MTVRDHLDQLGRAYGFTLSELESNRKGEIHPAQLARGIRKGIVSIVLRALFGVLVLGGGLVGAWIYYSDLGPAPSQVDLNAVYLIVGASVLVALGLFAFAAKGLARHRARKAVFLQGRIEVVDGPMNKIHISGRGGVPSQYIFRVGNRSLHVLPKLWELLTQGARYRLYYGADQLLSFEPVFDEDPNQRAEYEREAAHFEQTRNIKPSKRVK